MATRNKSAFGSIRRLPSKRWQIRYTGPDGLTHSGPKTYDTKVEADAALEKIRKRIYRETWDADDDCEVPPIKFADYATAWVKNRQVSGRPIKERTREHYEKLLDDHLVPAFGDRTVAGIRPRHVRAWYEANLTKTPTLRAHAYGLLRTIMGSAMADEIRNDNPCRIPGAGSAKRVKKIKPATVAELGTLTEAMPENLRLMVALASWCAMRFGETVELRRKDIDLNDEVIRIRRAAVRTQGGKFKVTTPKSEAGERDVAIPPHLVAMVADHIKQFAQPGPNGLLFPAGHGGHLAPGTLNRWWTKARTKAGREDLRWHDLRHSGAVLAAATGASLAELMARLGHSTPQAAMRYQHVAQGRDREIAARLSKIAANG